MTKVDLLFQAAKTDLPTSSTNMRLQEIALHTRLVGQIFYLADQFTGLAEKRWSPVINKLFWWQYAVKK